MADQGLLVEGRVLKLAIELMMVKGGEGHLTPKTPPPSLYPRVHYPAHYLNRFYLSPRQSVRN
jgi:hypothetical protein